MYCRNPPKSLTWLEPTGCLHLPARPEVLFSHTAQQALCFKKPGFLGVSSLAGNDNAHCPGDGYLVTSLLDSYSLNEMSFIVIWYERNQRIV